MTKQGLEELRLQVEVPTDGLPNLIQNPSGETGTWGWVTPVSGNYMATTGTALSFTVGSTSKASYFTTEFLPAVAGKYYSARVDVMSWTASHNIKVRFEWYDANKVLLSSSTQTAAFVGGTNYYGSVVAPTSTAYVKLRADFYNGTANPSANASITFMRAMVTYQDTGTVFSKRTNLIPNPSYAGSPGPSTTSGEWKFSSDNSYAWSSDSTTKYSGTHSVKVTNTAGRGNLFISPHYDTLTVTAGSAYRFQAQLYTTFTSVDEVRVRWHWYKSNGALIDTAYSGIRVMPTNSWYQIQSGATAPTGAAKVRVEIVGIDMPVNTSLWADDAFLEKSDTFGSFFDGDTTDTATMDYAWSGTQHNSASTATTLGNTFDYSEPNDWQDILGPTNEVSISRNALDVGTLSAVIIDDALDPAAANSIIKPGKKIRMQSLVDSTWENLFEGKISNALAVYERETSQAVRIRTRITLTATDNISTLANQSESRGVGTIAALPFILEGKGVPWNVNGSGNQITSATQVSSNDNTSVLDQVAITRDSVLGYAWVDRNNILQAWDSTQLSTAPVVEFADVAPNATNGLSYSDIDVNYNSDTAINVVNVKWLRYNSTKGTTEEVDYGPYKDQTSIDTWGARSAEFTIQGTAESSASIASYAQSILTANATPVIRCNSLSTPVTSDYERKWVTLLDLYDVVGVSYTGKVDKDQRITGIEHNIVASSGQVNWVTTYNFDVVGSVAAPTWTPSPNTAGNTVTPVTFQDVTVNNTFTASGFVKAGFATVTVNAVNTNYTERVTFPTPFPATGPVPMVMLTLAGVTHATASIRIATTDIDRNGFTINLTRSVGVANTGVNWLAVAV